MVHTKCPLRDRGKPSIEFWKDGKPQIYCYGKTDARDGEFLQECQHCPDWNQGDQCILDFEGCHDVSKQARM